MTTSALNTEAKEEERVVVLGEPVGFRAAMMDACRRHPMVIPATVSAITVPPAAVACVGIAKSVPVEDIAKLLRDFPTQLVIALLRR